MASDSMSGSIAPAASRRGLLTAVPPGLASIACCDRGRIGSKNANSTSERVLGPARGRTRGPIAPRPARCGLISSGSGSRRWPAPALGPAKPDPGVCALRRIGLAHTPLAHATCGTIRLRLLKIGALVRPGCRVSVHGGGGNSRCKAARRTTLHESGEVRRRVAGRGGHRAGRLGWSCETSPNRGRSR
jgi:hypothetical protein